MNPVNRKTLGLAGAALAAFVVLGGLAAGVAIYAGVYDVAATSDHTAFVRTILETARKRSVAARAARVPSPPAVDSAELAHAFGHYQEMCVTCHGAPGVEESEIGQGMNPTPPDLVVAGPGLTDREIFWIAKNGIKLAGMPAFGPTHSDDEIWGIVAFVRLLEDLTPEAYARWQASAEHLSAGDRGGGEGHSADIHATEGHGPASEQDATSSPSVPLMAHADAQTGEHAAPRDGAPGARGATGVHHPARATAHAAAPARPEPVATAGHARHPEPPTLGGASLQPRPDTSWADDDPLLGLVRALVRDPAILRAIAGDSALGSAWANPDLRRALLLPR